MADQPRRRPSRRTLTLIVTPLVAVFAISTVGNAIHPQLVAHHPLVLIAMEPRLRYLLLVARKTSFWPFLAVAVLRRLLSDPLYYLLGHLYGDAGVRWAERRLGEGGSVIRFYERAFGRAAPVMVFLFPGAVVCLLAGATGMSIPLFVTLNVVGTMAVVALTYRFAELVGGPIDAVNRFYARYNKWLLIISISFTVFWVAMQRRQGKGELRRPEALAAELEDEIGRAADDGADGRAETAP